MNTTPALPRHGTVDLQVNGYAGVDFNQDNVSVAQIRQACERMAADGVAAFLGTIITAQPEVIARRVAQLAEAHEQDDLVRSLMVGIHIEGPAISPADGFRGAHDLKAVRPATPELFLPMLDAGRGLVKLITLAPEHDAGMATTRRLVQEGCLVAAGHTDASLDDLKAAADAGLSLFTHLGNGCPMYPHRHDNIIQRCLHLRDRLTPCFIADGVHVPFVALANYLALTGVERAIVVTDAMPAAGLGPGRYTLAHWEVEVGDDLVAWGPGKSHLIGSCMTMPQAEANLREKLDLPAPAVDRLIRENPAAVLGLSVEKN